MFRRVGSQTSDPAISDQDLGSPYLESRKLGMQHEDEVVILGCIFVIAANEVRTWCQNFPGVSGHKLCICE
jgi:hypothetical protein